MVLNAGHPGVRLIAAAADKLQHRGLIHRQLREQNVVALDDVGVAAGVDYHLVERHIGVLHAADVALQDAVLECIRQHAQLAHGGIVRRVGAERRRLAFDRAADAVEVDHVGQAEIEHEIAALPGAGYYKADLGQLADGFCHGRARNAEGCGDLIDVQLGTGGNAQLNNIVVQKLRHQVTQLGVGVFGDVLFESVLIHNAASKIKIASIITHVPNIYKRLAASSSFVNQGRLGKRKSKVQTT